MQTRSNKYNFSRALVASILIMIILTGANPAPGQNRQGRTGPHKASAPDDKTSNPLCRDCWSGIISYTKTFDDAISTSEPNLGTLDPENERTTHNDTIAYKYSGRVLVSGNTGIFATGAQASVTSREVDMGSVSGWTRCHNFDPDRLIAESTVTEKTGSGTVNDMAEEFNITTGVANYHFGFRFPPTQGEASTEVTTSRKNFCPNSSPMPPPYRASRPWSEKDETVSIDGVLDPKNPDVITGTKTWGGEKRDGIATFRYTVRWKLQRKKLSLIVSDLKFFHPRYPSPNDWIEIGQNDFTTDGNQVKVVATITNLSGVTKTTNAEFKELKEATTLPGGSTSVTVGPFEERDVEMVWDTSGYAWRESGGESQPEINRQIEVEITDDAMTKDVRVYPKPIVLVAGLWSKKDDFRKFRDYFKIVSDKWRVTSSRVDIDKVSADNAAAVDKKVREVQLTENAWHVDLVAHSTGGLAARIYVNGLMPTLPDGKPAAIHLVMVGTPNLGTPCVDGMDGIISRVFNRNADAISELTFSNMKRFNLMVTGNNGTKFAAVAGTYYDKTCQVDTTGDGITPKGSATRGSREKMISTAPVNHMQLMGETSHFKQIYKWLAVPPKGDHLPATDATGNFSNEMRMELKAESFLGGRTYGAGYGQPHMSQTSSPDDADIRPDFTGGVKVAAHQQSEMNIPITAGSEMSVIVYATANVSLTLIDESGNIVGSSIGNAGSAEDIFRTISVKKTFGKGTWKLKLENTDALEAEIGVTAFIDYNARTARNNFQ